MAENVQIQCIDKTDRYSPDERISHVGGVHNGKRWKLTLDQAIAGIRSGTWRFYTSVNGISVWVDVAYHNGNPYLKTVPDGMTLDNLLSLEKCSVY